MRDRFVVWDFSRSGFDPRSGASRLVARGDDSELAVILFRGSFRGLENDCVVSSIAPTVLTFTRLGINPRAYLLALLDALANISHAELKDWLPHACAERIRLAALPVDRLAMSA